MRTFCNDLARAIPGSKRVNRGKLSMDGVAEKALELGANRVILVCRWKGGPGKIELFEVGMERLIPVPPLLYVRGVKLQREFKRGRPPPVRSLVVIAPQEGLEESVRIAEALSEFLNVPMVSESQAVHMGQAAIKVRVDPEGRQQITFLSLPRLVEIGPRITISRAIWLD